MFHDFAVHISNFFKNKKLGIYCISSRATYFSPEYPPTLFVVCSEEDSKYISSNVLNVDSKNKFLCHKESSLQNNNVSRIADYVGDDEYKVLMLHGKMKIINGVV
jgi:hypothetical protein